MISFIVAMDENQVIGTNNSLPWHIPDDLKRFKRITLGHPIVMGRKTFESIGRPLPGRENIILTTNSNFQPEGCTVCNSFKELQSYLTNFEEEVFVIGGAKIFQLFLPYVTKMYITKINHSFPGDVFFPKVNWNEFRLISREEGPNEATGFDYEYLLYERV